MDFSALLQQLNIDRSEFIFQFQSHPHYPSALAFSDTLRFMGLDNDAYELEKKYWNEIDQDFITVFDNNISLVKKSGDKYKVYAETSKIVDVEELKERSNELVILLKQEYKEKVSRRPMIWQVIIFALVVSVYLLGGRWNHIIFNLLSLLGLYISLEIFKEKFGGESLVLSNICGKVLTQKTSCEEIIFDDKTNIFGLKISDVSSVYFIAICVLGLFFPEIEGFLFWTSLCATLAVLYSGYVQLFVRRAVCKVCLFIISTLLLQAGLAFFTFTDQFRYTVLLYAALVFMIAFFGIRAINQLLTQRQALKKESVKNLRFKRNFELFELLLYRNPEIHFENKYRSFFFGERDADIHISLISNPFCGFCAEAHKIVEELLLKYPDHFSAQIRFNYLENSNSDLKKVISVFKFLYDSKGPAAALNKIHEWFTKKEMEELPDIAVDLSEEISVGNENLSHGFSFTPIILLNGRQFPDAYDRNDIFYFIDDLIDKYNKY